MLFHRSSSNSSRIRRLLCHSFSTAHRLPSRHSRHLPPRYCLDVIELTEETQRLLEAPPGTLFTHGGQTLRESSQDAWKICDETSQRFEYLIHGHSARVEGTIMNRRHEQQQQQLLLLLNQSNNNHDNHNNHTHINSNHITNINNADPQETIVTIKALLDRIEQEGECYMQLRKQVFLQHTREEQRIKTEMENNDESSAAFMEQMHQQVRQQMGLAEFVPSPKNNSNDNNNEDDNDDNSNDNNDTDDSTLVTFTSPGPTIRMYDTYLDTMAVHATENTPNQVMNVLTNIIQRYDDDGGIKQNINRHSTPTALSFNGVLRACANTPISNNKTRDEAITTAFTVYDAFREYMQPKNAASFAYMIQVVSKCIPPSLTRGNIALTLYKTAEEERVVDDILVEAMKELHAVSNGTVHDEWFEKHLKHHHAKGPVPFEKPFKGPIVSKETRAFAKKYRYREEENIY